MEFSFIFELGKRLHGLLNQPGIHIQTMMSRKSPVYAHNAADTVLLKAAVLPFQQKAGKHPSATPLHTHTYI